MKAEICKYWGGAKGAFTFTFDDGCYRGSSEEVIENYKRIYEDFGVKIKATVGITVGFMHEWIIKFWQEAADNGYFEIGSHSVGHDLSYLESTPLEVREKDAKDSKEQLMAMFPGQGVETYILPGGTYDEKGLEPLKKHYIAVRGNKDGINYPGEIDWYDVKCFTAMLKRPTSDYTDFIDEVIKTEGWGMQMNHWITHKEEDTFHSQNADTFHDECTYLGEKAKSGEVWIASFEEAAKYIQRYEQSEVKLTEKDGIYTVEIIGEGADKTDTPLTVCLYTDTPICLYNGESKGLVIQPRNGRILIPIHKFQRFSLEKY